MPSAVGEDKVQTYVSAGKRGSMHTFLGAERYRGEMTIQSADISGVIGDRCTLGVGFGIADIPWKSISELRAYGVLIAAPTFTVERVPLHPIPDLAGTPVSRLADGTPRKKSSTNCTPMDGHLSLASHICCAQRDQ